VIKFGRKGIQI